MHAHTQCRADMTVITTVCVFTKMQSHAEADLLTIRFAATMSAQQ